MVKLNKTKFLVRFVNISAHQDVSVLRIWAGRSRRRGVEYEYREVTRNYGRVRK